MNDLSFQARLSDRAARAGVLVSPQDSATLERYYRLLERWNRRINLTSLPLEQHPAETIDRLIVEALTAAVHIENAPLSWVDLGSGGGSPAIPLKIVRPRLRLLMTESRGRKAAFLREAVRELGLVDAEVLNERFETLAQREPGASDLVTARAVKVHESDASLFRHILAPEGKLLLFGYQESLRLARFHILHVGVLPGGGSRFCLLQKQ